VPLISPLYHSSPPFFLPLLYIRTVDVHHSKLALICCSQHWPVARCYPSIFTEVLRKTTKQLLPKRWDDEF
jgi:hypothetical protein